MHFCPKVPVMLVGCKKDLRRDGPTMQALQKQNQRTLTPEQVSHLATPPHPLIPTPDSPAVLRGHVHLIPNMLNDSLSLPSFRVRPSHRKLVPACTSSARPALVRVSAKSSNTPHAPLSSNQSARGVSASLFKIELADGNSLHSQVPRLGLRWTWEMGRVLMKGVNIGYCVEE